MVNEDDERCRKVFAELDRLCVTIEARESLMEWRARYARRYNRPKLASTAERETGKGFVSRIFGRNEGKTGLR